MQSPACFGSGTHLAAALIAAACLPLAASAVGRDKILYVGGTPDHFPINAPPVFSVGAPPTFEGRLDLKNETAFVFEGGRWGVLSIPYAAVQSIEYGWFLQGHPELTPVYGVEQTDRVPIELPGATFIKYPWDPFEQYTDKIHFVLTLVYRDESGRNQTAVFEPGRDLARAALQRIEQRTGKAVAFTDVRACMVIKAAEECGVGTPVELRGLRRLALHPSIEEDARRRLLAEIEQAGLGIEIVADPNAAQMVVSFWSAHSISPECPCEGGRGEVSIQLDARPRVVFAFTGTKRGIWGKNPRTAFGKAFADAYRAANSPTR